jgi:hypothetical protein
MGRVVVERDKVLNLSKLSKSERVFNRAVTPSDPGLILFQGVLAVMHQQINVVGKIVTRGPFRFYWIKLRA